MTIGNQFRKLLRFGCSPQFCLAALLGGFATSAVARVPTAVPEPSVLSLMAAGAVVAIVIYRIRGGK